MPETLIIFEPGDTPGNPPQTPDEYHFRVFDDLDMLLEGWERFVTVRGMSRPYLHIVRETRKRMREGWQKGTTVHHLIATVLAPAFLLPGELEVAGMTEEVANAIGIDLESAKEIPRTYPSLFDLKG